MTELHKAIESGERVNLALLETESGQAMVKELDELGDLPLHKACARYHDIILIEKLIDIFPKGVESKGRLGFLPIHHAAVYNVNSYCAAVELLISKYPQGLLCKNDHGDLPIHCANDKDVFFKMAIACPESFSIPNRRSRPISAWLVAHKFPKYKADTIEDIMLVIVKKSNEEKEKLQKEITLMKDSVEEMIKMKDALACVTKELECEKKMTQEARKIEKEFRAHLLNPDNEAAVTIDALKSVAKWLKTRLDLATANNKLQPGSNNSQHPSMVQLMFASFIKDPDVSRSSLVQCIEMLDAELSSLEQEQRQGGNEIQNDTTTTDSNDHHAAVDEHKQGGAVAESTTSETAEDQSTTAKKRARVSIS